MFGVGRASVVGLERALSRTPREVFPADSPTSTVCRGAAQGAKAETARRKVASSWCQLEAGAAATTTALDPAPDAKQAISR
jgi:hypothetical protein